MFQERGRRPETLRLVEQPETVSPTPEFRGRKRWAFNGLLLTSAASLGLALLLTVFAKQSHGQQPIPSNPAHISVGSFHSDSWFSNPETFSRVAELANNPNMLILKEKPTVSDNISIVNRSKGVMIALDLRAFASWLDQQEKGQPHIGIIFTEQVDKTAMEGITSYLIDVASSFPIDINRLPIQTQEALDYEVAIDLCARVALGVDFTNSYGKEAASLVLPNLGKLPLSHPARVIFDRYRTGFKSGKLQPFVKLVTINPFLPLRRSTPTILH